MSRKVTVFSVFVFSLVVVGFIRGGTVSADSTGATTLIVDRTDDEPSAQSCEDMIANDCSLRGAITKANADTANNYTIELAALTYNLTVLGLAEDANVAGDLDITDDLTIIGNGAIINVQGTGERVVEIDFFVSVTMENLTIEQGEAVGEFPTGLGGGIATNGTLNLIGVTVWKNFAETAGGGIYNTGNLTLIGSEVITNSSDFRAGGIDNGLSGVLILDESSVSDNTGFQGVGGIANSHNATVNMRFSDVSNNRSFSGGSGGISSSGLVTMSYGTLSNNKSTGIGGGGITTSGRFTATNSIIDGNRSSTDGGGINQRNSFIFGRRSTIRLIDSTVSNNTTINQGGGIYGAGDRTFVDRSTLVGNSADAGGGLYVDNGFTGVSNSTISGNTGNTFGGGVYNGFSTSAQFIHVTISDNTSPSGAGILARTAQSQEYFILSSIIAGNNGNDVERQGIQVGFVSNGYNVIGDGNGNSQFFATGDVINADALLNPLGNNGGATQTHSLQPDSPAVDRSQFNLGFDIDQRGVARPIGDMPDSGSYEGTMEIPLAVSLTTANSTANTPHLFILVLLLTIFTLSQRKQPN